MEVNPSSFSQAHVWISGTVQGVGYRLWTVQEAQTLNLKGWVRNLTNGRVEAVFEGEKSAIDTMVQNCHRGPRGATVTRVEVEMGHPEGLQGFEVYKTPRF